MSESGHGPDDWDDARLAAAFAARADAAAHSTTALTAITIDGLQAQPAGRHRFAWLPAATGAAAVVIVAAVGAAIVGSGLLVGATPPPSAASSTVAPASGAASRSPDASGTPGSDAAVSVIEALADRDASSEAGEIQVTGWIRGGIPVPCPAPVGPANPTRLDCAPADPWLVESRADAGPGTLNVPLTGPGFQPSFALVDTNAWPALQAGGGGIGTDPVEVTVTGHFHDRRAIQCEAFDCFSTFVVDRIDRVGATEVGLRTSYALSNPFERGDTISSVDLQPPVAADQLDPIIQHLRGVANRLQIINRRVMSADALLDAEPSLASGWPGIGTARIVTSVTAIETGEGSGPPRPRTFLFPDGAAVLSEMTAAGPIDADVVAVQSFPDLGSRLGEPITVSQAMHHRDRSLDGTELLVEGWAWAPGVMSCPSIEPGQPVLDQCPSTFTWLAERKPDPVAGAGLARPSGPAFNLVVPPESANLATLPTTPIRVAVLGHFDDHRAAACPIGMTERCRRNFAVDAILDPARLHLADALAVTIHPAPSNTPQGTATWAADSAGLPASDRSDRLISVFPIAVAALGSLEPQLAGTLSLGGVDTVWLIHFLDQDGGGNPIVRTRLVVDAESTSPGVRVYDVTADGMSPTIAAVTGS